MIIVFYGQPHSGKTTLANKLQEYLFLQAKITPPIIDGDEIRNIFKNYDYTREGRIKNVTKVIDIATYLHTKYNVVIISSVFAIKETREYLDSVCDNVVWVYLKYNELRGREANHIQDFDLPKGVDKRNLFLNTSIFSVEECIDEVIKAISL
jgi:adenylylsulfate kinase-like enzyme